MVGYLSFLLLVMAMVLMSLTPSFAQKTFDELEKAFEYSISRDFDRAQFSLSEMQDQAKSSSEKIRTLYAYSQFYSAKEQIDSALECMSRAENYARMDTSVQLMYNVLHSTLMIRRGRNREVIQLLLPSFNAVQTLSSKIKATYYLRLSQAYMNSLELDSAKYFLSLSRLSAQPVSDFTDEQIYYNYMRGRILLIEAKYDSAFHYTYLAYQSYAKSGHFKGKIITLDQMSSIELHRDNYNKGLEYASESVATSDMHGLMFRSGYYNMGYAYTVLERYDSALYAYRLLYQSALIVHNLTFLGMVTSGMGNIFVYTDQMDSAVVYYSRATGYFEDVGDTYNATLCKLALSNAYQSNNAIDLAEMHLHQGIKDAESSKNKALIQQAYWVSSNIRVKQKRFEEALVDYKKYIEVKDSISNEKVSQRIVELEITHTAELRKKENKKLSLEIEKKEQRERYLLRVYVLVVVVLIAIIVLLILTYIAKKRSLEIKKIQVEQAQLQEKVLIHKLSEAKSTILTKNKVIAKLNEEITTSSDTTDISSNLLEKINSSKEWAQFIIEFNTLYASFYANLEAIANDKLTKNDQRMAALIKLNLTNKEMAELLFVSPESIKKAKYRLAQKLNLGNKSLGNVINGC